MRIVEKEIKFSFKGCAIVGILASDRKAGKFHECRTYLVHMLFNIMKVYRNPSSHLQLYEFLLVIRRFLVTSIYIRFIGVPSHPYKGHSMIRTFFYIFFFNLLFSVVDKCSIFLFLERERLAFSLTRIGTSFWPTFFFWKLLAYPKFIVKKKVSEDFA